VKGGTFAAVGVCAKGVSEFNAEDPGLWLYTSEGKILHKDAKDANGGGFSSGDTLTVEVDLKTGEVIFYKNGQGVGLAGGNLLSHPAMASSLAPEERGIRPCVVVGPGAKAQLRGYLRGSNELVDRRTDPEMKKTYKGRWEGGTCTARWAACWRNRQGRPQANFSTEARGFLATGTGFSCGQKSKKMTRRAALRL